MKIINFYIALTFTFILACSDKKSVDNHGHSHENGHTHSHEDTSDNHAHGHEEGNHNQVEFSVSDSLSTDDTGEINHTHPNDTTSHKH